MDLRLSTAAVISFGPALSNVDGVTLVTTLVTAMDGASGIQLSKNGGAFAIRNGTPTATTYDAYGNYLVALNTTDTGTLGRLRMQFAAAATNLPIWQDFMVLPAAVWDALYAASGGLMPSSLNAALGTAITEGAAGRIAGAITKFYDKASPTGTINSIPDALAGATGGLFIAGSNAATTISGLTTGAFACTTFTASGAVAFQSTFAVTTSTSLAALSCTTLTASGAVAFQSTFAVTTSTSLAALSCTTLTASGAVAFQSTFATTGTTTFNAFIVTNATTLSGAVSLGSTLTVTGTTSLAALSTSGTATFNALTVSNATTLTGAVSLGSTLGVTGLTTLGGLTTGALTTSTITATGAVALQSTLVVTGTTTLTGAVTASNASNNINLGTGTIVAATFGAGAITSTVAPNLDAAVSSRMATYTQPTGFLAATFPSGTIANTTNITAGTVTNATNVTNLTNAPTVGDFTSTMKLSLNAATPVVTLAAGSITTVTFAAGAINSTVAPNLDVAVSTRLATTSYTAPDNTGIGVAATASVAAATNIGTNGSALTAIGDARMANLNATISSRGTANPGDAMTLATAAITDTTFSTAGANRLADTYLRRNSANARVSAYGDTLNFRSTLGAVSKLVNRLRSNSGVLETYDETDAGLPFGTQTITTDAAAEPITQLDTN